MFFLHFLRFTIGFEIRAIAAMVFSVKNETAVKAGAGNGCDKNKRNIFSEQAHREAYDQI
jgi:hypothetical protein